MSNLGTSILGNRVVRREDPSFLTGGGTYVENLVLENAVYLTYVRSTVAHGRITELEVDEARSAPGVVAVFTAADMTEMGTAPNVLPMFPEEMRRPYVADDVVRYVGQPVAAVLSETRAQGVDAGEQVYVDYDVLPAVIDLEEAARDEVVLFPDVGSNVLSRMKSKGQADFSDCEVVVEERINNQRLTAAPIEPRTGAAWWTDDGRLVHYSAVQGAHPTRDLLAKIFELETDQVRVVVPDVGGGFGAKSRTYPEELVLGWYARAIGRPVRWVETRSENIMAMPQGRGQLQYAKLGGTHDGLITAYQLDVYQDAGAYPIIGAVLAGMTQRMLTGTYEIRNVGFNATTVVTTKVSTTAYRGAGRPEAATAIERMIDRYAAEIGMDPAEVRRKNLVPRFTEPYTTGIGTVYDVGDYPEALRLALEAVDYDDLRAEQAARRARRDPSLLGIGIGVYVEITAGGPGGEFGSVELRPDGRLKVVSGSTPYGQGHETTWAMIVSDRTGIPMELIDVVHGDTDQVVRGGLTVGSRSVQVGGSAIAAATTQLIDSARHRAADLLEASVDDVVLDAEAAAFHVAGSPAVSISWPHVAQSLDDPLYEFNDYTPEMPTFPSGAHVAVVEVDQDTGAARLVRIVAADDAGRIINPLLAEGQVHGGLAQGIAQVLLENIEYDEYGNLLTSNFMDYSVISAAELPSFEVVHLETPTWVNELGAKGVGESGTVGAIPAVYNAVIDAVSHLGVHHLETPLTPEKVWRAIGSAG
ncbi:MAG: xanthine dehydrogenase family protein molybdopterin-binding subunit [Actinomycetia bacterium]|nr:xanthine dehydrogenase family protein molybdopterin-binding subunit [Actinomycetes bacterium]